MGLFTSVVIGVHVEIQKVIGLESIVSKMPTSIIPLRMSGIREMCIPENLARFSLGQVVLTKFSFYEVS